MSSEPVKGTSESYEMRYVEGLFHIFTLKLEA